MSTTPEQNAADLRIDAVDLIGRPGAHRRVERTVSGEGRLEGSPAMVVPAGDPITIDVQLESVVEGIYVGGTASAHLEGECSRCLDPVEQDVVARLDELFTYPAKVPADAEEDDIVVLDGDEVDLGPLLHDALVLAADERPLCREDCPGLCTQCGFRMEDDPEHHHDVIDERWAGLKDLFAKGEE